VTKHTDPERMRAIGRLGGLATAAARRQRALRSWSDAFLELVEERPDEFAARLFTAGNSLVQLEALKLAQSAKAAQLKRRHRELEEREFAVARRERDAELPARFEEWKAEADAEAARIEQEVAELEESRDALRAAIEAEADAAGYDMVEEEEEAGDAAAA
jgi:hypothetical protein